MAHIVVVNHIVNLGFALKACPRARLLLDTHDYFTRQAFEKASQERDLAKFSGRAELTRMAKAEATLWAIADFCTTVNEREQTLISKYAVRSEIVLPRPYVSKCASRREYMWDVLVVADQHEFNIRSVRWLLNVIRSNPALLRARIAIAGRIGAHIRRKEYSDLPNVRFLGFVPDLDALRDSARLSAIPDQAGTGIAIKTLTALAAAHPIVVTTIGARGLSPDFGSDLIAHDSANSFAGDIIRLLNDDNALETRRLQSVSAYNKLLGGWSFTRCLATIPEPDDEAILRRNQLLAVVLGSHGEQSRADSATDAANIVQWNFSYGGNAQSILRDGWHAGEPWGRWMDGPTATMEIKLNSPPAEPLIVTLRTRPCPSRGQVALFANGAMLNSRPARNVMRWLIPEYATKGSSCLRIELRSSTTHCWADHQNTADQRIVGIGVRSLTISKKSLMQSLFLGAGNLAELIRSGRAAS
jgi:hypothetical protein